MSLLRNLALIIGVILFAVVGFSLFNEIQDGTIGQPKFSVDYEVTLTPTGYGDPLINFESDPARSQVLSLVNPQEMCIALACQITDLDVKLTGNVSRTQSFGNITLFLEPQSKNGTFSGLVAGNYNVEVNFQEAGKTIVKNFSLMVSG